MFMMLYCAFIVAGSSHHYSQPSAAPVKLGFISRGTRGAIAGADPENLHGTWLMGWLAIVNYIGGRGMAG